MLGRAEHCSETPKVKHQSRYLQVYKKNATGKNSTQDPELSHLGAEPKTTAHPIASHQTSFLHSSGEYSVNMEINSNIKDENLKNREKFTRKMQVKCFIVIRLF